MSKVESAAEREATAFFDSKLARASVMVFSILVSAVAIPTGGWVINGMLTLQRDVEVLRESRNAMRAEFDRRISAAESQAAADRSVMTQLLKTTTASEAILQSLSRDVTRLVTLSDQERPRRQ